MLPVRKPAYQLRSWICNSCRQGLADSSSKPRRRRYATASTFQLKEAQELPSTPARTRFAPSPTGYLHLGSLRTALYNYLLAKATGGQFLLRIEDTDSKRTIAGAEERICEDLDWAGLQWDEGPKVGGPHGPYRQSERTFLYKKHAAELLESHHAYRCFCTQDRLDSLARQQTKLGLPANYDRTCANIHKNESDERSLRGESHVIRLQAPAQYARYMDLVYGMVGSKKGAATSNRSRNGFEDPILVKSDGLPTYHLANVVDDHYMEITHVIRGMEWMSSTPKHLQLYKAFGWQPPAFAHVGLLQDSNRQKMSKRNLTMDLETIKREGIFPEALMNFAALLGWSHGMGSDVLPRQELIDNFNLKFTKGNVVVQFPKLYYFQTQYFRKYQREDKDEYHLIVDRAVVEAKPLVETMDPDVLAGRTLRDFVKGLLRIDTNMTYTTPIAFIERNKYFFSPKPGHSAQPKLFDVEVEIPRQELVLIAAAARRLEEVQAHDWLASHLRECVVLIKDDLAKSENVFAEGLWSLRGIRYIDKILHRWLRWAIVNGHQGPSMVGTMEVFGRDVVLQRLKSAEAALLSEESLLESKNE